MSAQKRVVVIGAGPGGYVAAIRCAQLGCHVSVVEKENLGGVCLNWGCIPTKALLTCAENYDKLSRLKTMGISVTGASFDLGAMVDYSRTISARLSGGVAFLMKKNKINVVSGTAALGQPRAGVHRVQVALSAGGEKDLDADAVILATGSRPILLPDLSAPAPSVWTSKEAMLQRTLPASLAVIGSGAIGLEFASFYAHLGTKVTVIEREKTVLPTADPSISAAVLQAFEKRGIRCLVGQSMTHAKQSDQGWTLKLDGGKEVVASAVLQAIGVRGNTENMGLEAMGVTLNKGRVRTDAHLQTNVPGIYAIGDVTDGPWLAHKASHEGILCAEHIAGKPGHALGTDLIPGCIYSTPQVASVGMTQPEAQVLADAGGFSLRVGQFPFSANGKALAMGAGSGHVKTIFHGETGELLGAHMIGPGVTELISNFSLVKGMEGTEEDLMQTIFPHPTLSEALHESVLDAFDRGIHGV